MSYKAAAVATVKEYLSSSDMQEVVSSLTELQQPHLAHIFVKQVSLAIIMLSSLLLSMNTCNYCNRCNTLIH